MEALWTLWIYRWLLLSAAWILWGSISIPLWIKTRRINHRWNWNIFWILWWFTFACIWFENWKDTVELWSPDWLFDSLGHFLFGFSLVLNEIYIYRVRSKKGNTPLLSRKTLWLLSFSTVTIFITGTLGWGWELLENYWDENLHHLFPWLGKAQKGQLDTIIDLAVNPTGTAVGLLIYLRLERFWYRTSFLAETRLKELWEEYAELVQQAEILRKQIGEENWKNAVRQAKREKPILRRFLRLFEKRRKISKEDWS